MGEAIFGCLSAGRYHQWDVDHIVFEILCFLIGIRPLGRSGPTVTLVTSPDPAHQGIGRFIPEVIKELGLPAIVDEMLDVISIVRYRLNRGGIDDGYIKHLGLVF